MRKGLTLAAIPAFCTLGVLPIAIGFPTRVGPSGDQHDITLLLLGVVFLFDLGIVTFSVRKSEAVRNRVLRMMMWLAATSVTASILLGIDVHVPVLVIPTPHILAPLFQVDGQYADLLPIPWPI